jgi:selenide,water dikinase
MLDSDILPEIVRGAGDIAREAGIAIVGGHSVDDPEPKFGMCVIGEVHPNRIVRNSTARAGDVLVLTKAIGTGVIATAIKKGAAPDAVIAGAVRSMTKLNRDASAAMLRAGVSAATDVMGFGLIGHLRSMARQSGVAARVHARAVPLLEGAADLAAQGHIPGGTERNRADAGDLVSVGDGITASQRILLFDAQTSGGLLICVTADAADGLLADLHGNGSAEAAIIGEMYDGPAGTVVVE